MLLRILPALLAVSFSTAWAADSYNGLGAASVTPETVARFQAKPLPSDLSRKVQSILDLRSPGAGQLTPDGKTLFFTWRVTGTTQVWRIDGPKQFPVQMTGGEDATGLQDITPDGKWLVLSRDRKGEENPGLYLQPVKGGALVPVQHKEGVQTVFSFVSKDGQWLYYRSNDESRDSYTIYRYNLNTQAREKIYAGKGMWYVTSHRDDGRLILARVFSNVASEYYEWSPKTRDVTPLLGQGEKEDYYVEYGLNEGEYLVTTNKFGEAKRLYLLKNGKFTPISPDGKWDVSEVQLDRAQKRLYYSLNEAGYTRSFAVDAVSFKPLKLPAFAGADHVRVVNHSLDGRYLNLSVETANAPRASYVLDWKTGKLTQWTLPSTPEIDPSRFAVARLESYPARDGTRIPMFVRRPASCPGQLPCPVVVHFHGGPEGQSDAGFSPYAQLFVDAGFVFVEPNVRGSSGYGKSWINSDNGPKRLNVVTDIEDASRYIRANWGKNGLAPKVGVMGGSYGGYSTLAAMTMFSGAYDAGVSSVGISNLVSFLQNTAPYRRANRSAEYGDLVKDREALIKLSPVSYIDKLKDPLLIIQGVSDPRVPVGEALQMYEALQKKRVEGGLILFADEGHGASKRENQVLEIGHTLQFFQKHLSGPSRRIVVNDDAQPMTKTP